MFKYINNVTGSDYRINKNIRWWNYNKMHKIEKGVTATN
mgnify:CR=1 FL=1